MAHGTQYCMTIYHLEFILYTHQTTLQEIKSALAEFGEALEVFSMQGEPGLKGRHFKVTMRAGEPTVIFDICGQLGRITSAKVT